MKRQSSKLILGAAAVALLIAAGTFLPGQLALGRDRVILGQVLSEPLDAAELSDYVNISMVDKAGLLAQSAGVTFVTLNIGAEYNENTIRAKFLQELDKLHELRFYPLPAGEGPLSIGAGVTLYIQNDAPAINMIVWEINVRTDNLSGVFFMDDQTGKILSFMFTGSGYANYVYTEDMVKSWASYLGAEVRNVKKGPEPDTALDEIAEVYYRFGLHSGTQEVNGQMSSFIQNGEGKINRWSLNYLQVNDNRITIGPS